MKAITTIRLRQLLIGAGVVLLLTFLFIKSSEINFDEHNRFSGNLRRLKELNATLNENILKARFGLLTSYDSLVINASEINKLQHSLELIPSFVDDRQRQEIALQLKTQVILQARRENLLERFKSQNAVLNNSLRFFPLATSELARKLSTDQSKQYLTATLNDLLRDVLIYASASDGDLAPRIRTETEVLRENNKLQSTAGDPDDLEIIGSHANAILRLKPEVDNTVKELVSLQTSVQIENLDRLYNSTYDHSLRRSNVFRLCLYIFSIVLLAYIGFIIAKLKRATLALNASKYGLEQSVAERTGELLLSNVELKKSEANNSALLHAIPDSMWRTDRSGVFIDVIPAKGENSSGTALDWIGKTIKEVLPPDVTSKTISHTNRALDTGITQVFEYQLNQNGNIRNYEARVVVSGENETLSIVRDITEQKQMEQQLQQSQKLESIGQLAAGIAHEINTPTQYVGDNTRFLKDCFHDIITLIKTSAKLINGYRTDCVASELLSEYDNASSSADVEYLSEEIPSAIRQSLDGIERIATIVQSIKDFAHPGATSKTAVDLNKAIESTVTVAGSQWKYVANMKLDLSPDLPAVPCFLGEFNQVMLNMIVNSSHAIADVVGKGGAEKGAITISTMALDGWAEINISDTGAGIPAELHSKIFDPFFTTKEVGKGSGQGLAISRNVIVEKHRGTLSFDSEVGKGTTFKIRLPLHEALTSVSY